jgi:hypothetical protein
MGRNTQMMIHDAWGIGIGPAADMRDLADRLDKLSNNIASMYADKAGGELADWRALMLAETWYDADEAVAAGLADEVEGAAEADDDEIVVNAFDLSVFKHPGRAAAPEPVIPREPEPAPEPVKATHDDRAMRFRFRQRAAARR